MPGAKCLTSAILLGSTTDIWLHCKRILKIFIIFFKYIYRSNQLIVTNASWNYFSDNICVGDLAQELFFDLSKKCF